jgi:hypothetical protein
MLNSHEVKVSIDILVHTICKILTTHFVREQLKDINVMDILAMMLAMMLVQ